MNYRIFGGFLILIALIIFGTVAYRNSHRRQRPIIYSTEYMLSALWNSYKSHYVDAGTGRAVDRQRGDVTTSEGQSYAMLRAVWEDDRTTFDAAWQWTKNNLKRPNDNLFSWLYGKRDDGSMGVQTSQGGQNSATDADTDIAVALIFASNRWGNTQYLDEAKKIIPDIWMNEVVNAGNTPYITADNIEKDAKTTLVINPSYFAPYAYKIFAEIDAAHPWQKVVDSSYDVINKSIAASLDKQNSAGLPPDWLLMDKASGQLLPPSQTTITTNFGYDALRLPYRLALDYNWNGDERAKNALQKLSFLSGEWQSRKSLVTTYSHDGRPVSNLEAPSMYGGTIGYFLITHPSEAVDIYNQKLVTLYSPDYQDWKQPLSYYDDNWAWFGLALYNQKLINLYKS